MSVTRPCPCCEGRGCEECDGTGCRITTYLSRGQITMRVQGTAPLTEADKAALAEIGPACVRPNEGGQMTVGHSGDSLNVPKPARWWVMMMVSTTVEADNAAEAEQMACDLLHPLVMDAKLGIHSVEKVIDVSEGRKASEIVDELGEQT